MVYSFPFRLLLLHLKSNLLLLGMWLLLIGMMTGVTGRKLGIQYLLLDPEYLGKVNFWSFFILGLTFGSFYMTWNLTTYLISAHHFPFLATLSRPFTKFCINNLLLPSGFILFYLGQIIYFQAFFESWNAGSIILHCLGFLSGMVMLMFLYFLYFHFTNRDISYYDSRKFPPPNLMRSLAPGFRTVDLEYIKLDDNRWRVDTYLNENLRPRIVRSVAHYDSSLLMSIFRQNHLNALIIQLLGMVVLVTLGSLIDYPLFRIPAAASFLLMLSIFTAIIGAISYWFSDWKVTILILLLIFINFFTSFDIFSHRNPAYGLDYQAPPAEYSYSRLHNLSTSALVEEDKKNTVAILENWNRKVALNNGEKPKMVILCASGGGLKSSIWTTRVVQQADSLLEGRLLNHTVLITGASGGMMGMAYLREIYRRQQQGAPVSIYAPQLIDNISKDLLNSLAFTLVTTDLFLPWAKFETGGYTYRKDRGYIFEQQLNENTDHVLDRTVDSYRQPEQSALIPMLYITPSIVNDARRLIISPQGVSFMMIPPIHAEHLTAIEVDAVDFGLLFAEQGAGNLRFTSALRMNATYPYILPSVHLPSSPKIEVMDAGFRDNYGILSAARFIQVFQTWIRENTGGVVLVQISSSEKIDEVTPSDNKGIIESLFNPIGIPSQFVNLQEYEQDNSLGFIYDLLGQENFHIIRFTFRPEKADQLRATISFHITDREKQSVINAIYEEENQSSLRQLIDLLQP